MAYQKQTWRDYDDTKTELVNMNNGAVVTPERMNHIETGIANAAVASEVTAQLAHEATFQSNKDSYTKAVSVTPKAIYNQFGVVMVVSKKPHGNGFVRFKLRDNQYTTNVSVGAPAELLRVLEVLEVSECFTLLNKPKSVDVLEDWTSLNVNYTVEGVGQQALPINQMVNRGVGKWIEFETSLPSNVNEVVVLIYKTTGSSADVDISVNGETTMSGVSFYGTGFERIVVSTGRSGKHTIRFTTNEAKHMNIAGINVVDLDEYRQGYEYDTLLTLVVSASRQYVTAQGAMDYALLDADTDLWCGSYHGGETRNRLQYILDGETVEINDGDIKIGNVFEIEQDTNIVNKINAYSTQRFEGDGSVVHETVFDGDINLKTLFTNMTTALDSFDEVIYPTKEDMSSLDDNGRIYLPEGINYVVQRNPSTLQKVITIMNNKKYPVDQQIVPYIRKTVGAYNKLYNANIQNERGVNFKAGHFKTMHIFE